MHTIILRASPRDIIIHRIHRIAKPPHLAASVPRDVLMRIHFFHIKEKLLAEARTKTLPSPYEGMQFFRDHSKYTLQLRIQLNSVTKGLPNHKSLFKCHYPAILLITRNGTSHVVTDLYILTSSQLLPVLTVFTPQSSFS